MLCCFYKDCDKGLKMSKQTVFYYHFEPIGGWFILNAVMLITFGYWSVVCPCLLYWSQMQVLLSVTAFSWLAWGWKNFAKHRLAVFDGKSITIDNCQPLFWKDIKAAEERMVRCGLRKYRVIVLIPKDGIDYKYNFLQKHCGNFTAFSLPLYNVVTPDDAAEMIELVNKKVKIKRLPETKK